MTWIQIDFDNVVRFGALHGEIGRALSSHRNVFRADSNHLDQVISAFGLARPEVPIATAMGDADARAARVAETLVTTSNRILKHVGANQSADSHFSWGAVVQAASALLTGALSSEAAQTASRTAINSAHGSRRAVANSMAEAQYNLLSDPGTVWHAVAQFGSAMVGGVSVMHLAETEAIHNVLGTESNHSLGPIVALAQEGSRPPIQPAVIASGRDPAAAKEDYDKWAASHPGFGPGGVSQYQCTGWANYRWFGELKYPGGPIIGHGGSMAAHAGNTSITPTQFALASLGAGTDDDPGHVMIVEEVLDGGNRIRVSEMNVSKSEVNPLGFHDDVFLTRDPDDHIFRRWGKPITFAAPPN